MFILAEYTPAITGYHVSIGNLTSELHIGFAFNLDNINTAYLLDMKISLKTAASRNNYHDPVKSNNSNVQLARSVTRGGRRAPPPFIHDLRHTHEGGQ